MATVQLQTCVAEGDLAAALLAFEEQLGDAAQNILNQISQFDDIAGNTALILQGQNLLNQEILPMTSDDLTNQSGLPLPAPVDPILADEARLAAFGLYLIHGIIWLKGGNGNIEDFRRLFFAVGSDLNMFLSIVNSGKPFVVVQTHLQVKQLPQTGQWTVDQARALFQNDAIESVYLAGDGIYYVVIPTFLAVDTAKDVLVQRYQIPAEEISSQVFWFTSIPVTNQTITQLKNNGLDDNQRLAALSAQRLIDARPSAYQTLSTTITLQTSNTIQQCQLFQSRYNQLDQAARNAFTQDISKSVTQLQLLNFQLEDQVRFYGTLIPNPGDIGTFLTKNSQADLTYLFTKRREIQSIDFTATSTDVANRISQAFGTQAGNTSTSSILANSLPANPSDIDPTINTVNTQLVSTFCAESLLGLKQFTLDSLNTTITCLQVGYVAAAAVANPVTPQTGSAATPVQGYQSFDSPAQIINRSTDLFATLNTNAITDAINALAAAYTGIFKVLLELLARLIKAAKAAADQVIAALRQQINDLTRKLQAFLSQYLGMHGTATLDSSLLKCAVGFQLSPELPILTDLSNLVSVLNSKIQNLMAQIEKVISDLVNTLLCLPINLLNGFISSSTSGLPSFCQVYKVQLPQNIQDLLSQIQNTFQLQSEGYAAYNRDLFRLNATISSLPAKMDSFKESLACQSSPVNNLFGSITSSLSIGSNPLAGLANTISGVPSKIPGL